MRKFQQKNLEILLFTAFEAKKMAKFAINFCLKILASTFYLQNTNFQKQIVCKQNTWSFAKKILFTKFLAKISNFRHHGNGYKWFKRNCYDEWTQIYHFTSKKFGINWRVSDTFCNFFRQIEFVWIQIKIVWKMKGFRILRLGIV